MSYVLLFLEGIITFISPCLLPMLPAYVSYFAGRDETKKNAAVVNAIGFVFGFTVIFSVLGLFAGTLGTFLRDHQMVVNIVCGAVLILFGLNFMEVIQLPFINAVTSFGGARSITGFFSALLFGIVFSVTWTPCVGTFLGSALVLAAQSGDRLEGFLLLLSFSLGLGLPFILCAVLLDKLKTAFDFIKKHYKTINRVSGALLVVLGILIATGTIGYLYAFL